MRLAETKLGPDVTTHCTTVLHNDKQLHVYTGDYATVLEDTSSDLVPDYLLFQVGRYCCKGDVTDGLGVEVSTLTCCHGHR